jgi:hypothetical protein
MGLDSDQPGNVDMPWPSDDGLGSEVSQDLRARVKRELEPGERLLWATMSRPRPIPLGAKFFLGCAAFPVFIIVAAAAFANGFGHLGAPPRANEAAPVMLGMIMVTFAIMLTAGLSITWFSRPADARRISQTCYAVTDRRAILWVPDAKTDAVRIISVRRGEIESVIRAERPDGSGDLEMWTRGYVGHFPWHPFGFRNVPDVRRVELIVRNNLVTHDSSKKRPDREPD